MVFLFVAVNGLTACAPTSLYDWGRYEDSLYLRYAEQDFGQAESYLTELLPSTAHPSRIPPGVCADYGYLLYRRGDYGGAIQFFEKEKQIYPESSALMTKLIDRVHRKLATRGNNGAIKKPDAIGEAAR